MLSESISRVYEVAVFGAFLIRLFFYNKQMAVAQKQNS